MYTSEKLCFLLTNCDGTETNGTFLLVNMFKMLGMSIELLAPSSPQKHITKASDGFHINSNLLTIG